MPRSVPWIGSAVPNRSPAGFFRLAFLDCVPAIYRTDLQLPLIATSQIVDMQGRHREGHPSRFVPGIFTDNTEGYL